MRLIDWNRLTHSSRPSSPSAKYHASLHKVSTSTKWVRLLALRMAVSSQRQSGHCRIAALRALVSEMVKLRTIMVLFMSLFLEAVFVGHLEGNAGLVGGLGTGFLFPLALRGHEHAAEVAVLLAKREVIVCEGLLLGGGQLCFHGENMHRIRCQHKL